MHQEVQDRPQNSDGHKHRVKVWNRVLGVFNRHHHERNRVHCWQDLTGPHTPVHPTYC